MISTFPLLRAVVIGGSAAAHIWLAMWYFQSAPTQIEGGSLGSQEARLGNSFDDFATGVLTPETDVTEVVQPLPAEQPSEITNEIEPMAPLEPEEPAEVEETAPIKTVETATEVLEIIQPEIAIAVETTGATNVALPTSETEALPSTTPVDLTTALQPELETLTASEPDAPTTSLKPAVRSRAIEQAQQNPQPVRRQAAPSGNATQNAVRGSTTGTTTATAAQQSANRGNVAQEGNAAATNYPGVVMRKISGVPRPRVRASSVATVRFVIARAGGLNSVSIARSSGNSSLDAAALQVIRQAAPFPAPPPGAQRTFTIRIRGRG